MSSISIKTPTRIWPLLCPQIPFKDRFGNYSSFLEMNPAAIFDEEAQEWIVIVRGVNYRKLINKTSTLYHHPAHSVYWIAHGPDLDKLVFTEMKYYYGNLPQYASYWNGIEDARFVDTKTIIVTVPQLSEGGKPTMFLCDLIEKNHLENFRKCEPSGKPEKNWMPFAKDKVIYDVCPLIIKDLQTSEAELLQLPPHYEKALEGYHGSTNGVQWQLPNQYLFLIHKMEDKMVNRWILLNVETKELKITEPFCFFPHSYIEFPCSLTYHKNKLIVGMGVNDDHAFLVEVDQATIFN
jgi:hypothetical protein